MALPTLDATFASAADLPRRMMLAKWLVEEKNETAGPSSVLVSGAGTAAINGIYFPDGTDGGKTKYTLTGTTSSPLSPSGFSNSIYWTGTTWQIVSTTGQYTSFDNVTYPWLVTSWLASGGSNPVPTVTEIPAANPISNYYDLPERYLWAKIAVAAGAPKTEADYISLPKNYVWSDIYNAVSGDIAQSTVVVSGLSATQYNGRYVYDGQVNGRPSYALNLDTKISWGTQWEFSANGDIATSASDVAYPWLATGWIMDTLDPTGLVLTPQTPNHTDWSEKQALGHIAAAYRGDTANSANLATYIDWPWRYQVASIIGHLSGETFPSDGLIAFWKLDNEADSSGNGNTLINNNNVTFVTGKIGNAASINNNDLSVNLSFNFLESWSISLWFNHGENIENIPTIIDCGDGLGGSPVIDLRNETQIGFNNGFAEIINAEFTPNTWTHVALSSDGSSVDMYVNGSYVDSASWTAGEETSAILIGNYTTIERYFNGLIDAVGIWSRAISESEIEQLYNSGSGIELS